MNTYQALRTLNVSSESSQEEIRTAYRKMALELHPDKNSGDGTEFKRITEAYNHLKNSRTGGGGGGPNNGGVDKDPTHRWESHTEPDAKKRRYQWGAGPQDGTIPEQDWSRFTKHVEDEDPEFWKEYERKFWEDYNAKIKAGGSNGEYSGAPESDRQPNVFVEVDKSLCIGCCSCETIAPDVFEINKESMMNPKSSVINQKGAGINKIMSAAETCPTKAIKIEDADTKERIFPY